MCMAQCRGAVALSLDPSVVNVWWWREIRAGQAIRLLTHYKITSSLSADVCVTIITFTSKSQMMKGNYGSLFRCLTWRFSTWILLHLYMYAFSRHFFIQSDLQYIQVNLYIFCHNLCSLGIEPTTFALLTQCSTTEPPEHYIIIKPLVKTTPILYLLCHIMGC